MEKKGNAFSVSFEQHKEQIRFSSSKPICHPVSTASGKIADVNSARRDLCFFDQLYSA